MYLLGGPLRPALRHLLHHHPHRPLPHRPRLPVTRVSDGPDITQDTQTQSHEPPSRI